MLQEPTYSINDCQKILGKDKSTIYRMIKNNQLKTLDIRPLRVNIMQLRSAMLSLAPESYLLWSNQEVIK